MKLAVDYNEQWFLHVLDPAPVAGAHAARAWAEQAVSTFNVVSDWTDAASHDELVETVLDQSSLFTADVAAGFLYCPRGLPATAVVEVALSPADGFGALAALDRIPEDETALPRQVIDVTSSHLGEGVLVHGVAVAGEDSLVGIATYSFVSDGCHVLITITSPDLNAITLGRVHFDELVDAIVLHD